jgi:hypothetical protein
VAGEGHGVEVCFVRSRTHGTLFQSITLHMGGGMLQVKGTGVTVSLAMPPDTSTPGFAVENTSKVRASPQQCSIRGQHHTEPCSNAWQYLATAVQRVGAATQSLPPVPRHREMLSAAAASTAPEPAPGRQRGAYNQVDSAKAHLSRSTHLAGAAVLQPSNCQPLQHLRRTLRSRCSPAGQCLAAAVVLQGTTPQPLQYFSPMLCSQRSTLGQHHQRGNIRAPS